MHSAGRAADAGPSAVLMLETVMAVGEALCTEKTMQRSVAGREQRRVPEQVSAG